MADAGAAVVAVAAPPWCHRSPFATSPHISPQHLAPCDLIYYLITLHLQRMLFSCVLDVMLYVGIWYDGTTVRYTTWKNRVCDMVCWWYGMMVRFDILYGKNTVRDMVCWS